MCRPAHAKLRYRAHSEAPCGSDTSAAQGDWVLTITEVSPVPDPYPYLKVTVHGHLQARLINQSEPSDSVVLSLDF